MLTGIGARVRAARNTYLFVEASPRVAGYNPGVTLISFGFEQRAGGHLFQLNFSNGYGTTLAQVARGGTAYDDWYLGSTWRGNFSEMKLHDLTGLAAAAFVAMTAAACGGGSSSTPTTPTPAHDHADPRRRAPRPIRRRSPSARTARSARASVTITRGGRVTMVNNDSRAHDMSVGS